MLFLSVQVLWQAQSSVKSIRSATNILVHEIVFIVSNLSLPDGSREQCRVAGVSIVKFLGKPQALSHTEPRPCLATQYIANYIKFEREGAILTNASGVVGCLLAMVHSICS